MTKRNKVNREDKDANDREELEKAAPVKKQPIEEGTIETKSKPARAPAKVARKVKTVVEFAEGPQTKEREPSASTEESKAVEDEAAVSSEGLAVEPEESCGRDDIISSIKLLLKPRNDVPSREDLLRASKELQKVSPYNFEAWRLHADVLLAALEQLERRAIQPDVSFKLMTIPLREDEIRDAAEDALRQCAHYADSWEKRVSLIDEANRVRRMTWL
jgi:hypothetical protein